MYLGQELALMSAYLIYALPSLKYHDLKMMLYVSLWKSLLKEGIKNRFLNKSDHNKNAANESKEYTNIFITKFSAARLHNDKK